MSIRWIHSHCCKTLTWHRTRFLGDERYRVIGRKQGIHIRKGNAFEGVGGCVLFVVPNEVLNSTINYCVSHFNLSLFHCVLECFKGSANYILIWFYRFFGPFFVITRWYNWMGRWMKLREDNNYDWMVRPFSTGGWVADKGTLVIKPVTPALLFSSWLYKWHVL